MRGLIELIDHQRSGWLTVQEYLKEASNNYEVLPCDPILAGSALHQLQVTTFSPLGSLVYETGGILIDNGWLRILGSGHSQLTRTPASWTQSVTPGRTFQALLVADDVSGGFFALNGGEFGEDRGGVYYLAPDSLEWENLDMSYSGLLNWALHGNLDRFYQSVRWAGWREEISAMCGNKVYSFYPYLWTEPKLPIEQRSRAIVPIDEHWLLSMNLQRQITNMQRN
ncbi:DUF2625 domain-containing protein [Yersinia massiliensis]|uniref:DUF2625 domain-containing protein n=1 Tax=Yersinia massiliensis TaxID=419257 RepID=A0AA91BAZ1_9GAMM|nr:DUF2625 domain-containing protein [Yersinia massiliensis]NIL26890.1 DUF2625 domain-containing protein [Yersinia massiliensis]